MRRLSICRINGLSRTAKSIRMQLSEHSEGYVELMKIHYIHTTATSRSSNSTAVSFNITKAISINVELSGTFKGNFGLNQKELSASKFVVRAYL